MTLTLEEEVKVPFAFDYRLLAEEVVLAALTSENFPYEAEVNLLLTMNEDIRRMNEEFRGLGKATDVLSFPMAEFEKAGDFEFLESADEYFHPETGELILGDIVISKEKVVSQAEEFGHSIMREFSFLITHSMLHLMGYDHEEEEERIEMERMQEEILEKLEILR